MITLLAKPLRPEGRVLLPTGSPIVIDSDYLNIKRAVVEECHAKGWTLSSKSAELRRWVAGETMPLAVARTKGGILMGIWRVGGGDGRLVLLTHDRNFVEWGPGCCMVVERDVPAEGWSVIVPLPAAHVVLGTFASEKQACAVRALWLDAILGAPYGGLLRYDDATESVVDELAPEEGAFEDDELLLAPTQSPTRPVLPAPPAEGYCPKCHYLIEMKADTFMCKCQAWQPPADAPEYQCCPECKGFLLALLNETEGKCVNPFCSLAVERTEAELLASRRVPVETAL